MGDSDNMAAGAAAAEDQSQLGRVDEGQCFERQLSAAVGRMFQLRNYPLSAVRRCTWLSHGCSSSSL